MTGQCSHLINFVSKFMGTVRFCIDQVARIMSEDLGKRKPKTDTGIFIGYSHAKKSYRIYNQQTRLIMETIYIDFDELTAMASKQFSSGPELKLMTPGTISSGLEQNSSSSTPYVSPTNKD
ncbi:hypothetical protein Tco_0457811 [Tanacetum coccineum]